MKTRTAITAIVFAGIFQLAWAQPPNSVAPANATAQKNQTVSANVTVRKHQIQVTTPWSGPASKKTGKIERFGNMSSRPWTQIVGWHPGAPSWSYEDGEIHEPQFQVVSVNF